MTSILLICGLILTAAALAAAVLVLRRLMQLDAFLCGRTLEGEHRLAHALSPNTAKFRVVFATESGARARDLFALLQPRDDDKIELWNFGDCRARKP